MKESKRTQATVKRSHADFRESRKGFRASGSGVATPGFHAASGQQRQAGQVHFPPLFHASPGQLGAACILVSIAQSAPTGFAPFDHKSDNLSGDIAKALNGTCYIALDDTTRVARSAPEGTPPV